MAFTVLAGGVALSALVFGFLSQRERVLQHTVLSEAMRQSALALQRDADLYVENLNAIAAFYSASQNVERQEFATFVRSYHQGNPGLMALEWVPRVKGEDRAAFVESAAREGLADYRLKQIDGAGNMMDAAERSEYFPVLFAEPFEANRIALGFDHGSEPERLMAMYKARDSAAPTATNPMSAFRLTGGELGALVFRPIYESGDVSDSPEFRRSRLAGFAVALLDLNGLVHAALQTVNGPDIHYHLFHSVPDDSDQPLYSEGGVRGGPGEPPTYGLLKKLEFFESHHIQLADRVWVLTGVLEPASGAARLSWKPYAGAGIILLLGVLAALVLAMTGMLSGGGKRMGLFGVAHCAGRMGSFFRDVLLKPGVALMGKLAYPKKFALISALFILPLGFTMIVLLAELEERIHFSQKEMYGVQYLEPLQGLLENASSARRLSYLYRRGESFLRPDIIETQARIRDDFKELKLADSRFGKMLAMGTKLDDARSNWMFLEAGTDRLSSEDMERLFESFIKQIRSLISLVGDTSNLILDPDLDTYYLMDAVLLKIPEIQSILGETKIFAGSTVSKGTIMVEDESEFIRLSGLIRFNLNEIKRGLDVAYRNDRTGRVRRQLGAPLADFENEIDNFLSYLDGEISTVAQTQIPIETLIGEIRRASLETRELWEASMLTLDQLLERRIDRARLKKWVVAAFCACMLALVLYVWLAFYQSVMRTVVRIEETSRRMMHGEIGETVLLETGDELGRVVQSFNQIAVGLKHERDQALEGRARLHAIYESSPLGIFFAKENGNLEYVNAAYQMILGFGRDELSGKNWFSAVHPDDREKVESDWEAVRSEGKAREIGCRVLTKDGSGVWVRMNISPVQMAGGTLCYVGVVEDITRRRELESQLLQWQKMESVGTLAGGVAHDLNNQLTPIRGYLDLIIGQVAKDEKIYPLLVEANKSAIRSAEIVERLVNFSKPSSRRKEAVPVNAMLADLGKLFANFLPSTIVTEFSGQELDLWVLANSTEIQTVFTNLAANARDAMPQGGKLTIAVERESRERQNENKVLIGGAYACLRVRDTGMGMPAGVQGRIFEPFYTTKGRDKGTGLGLTMAFQIVRDHGGWIEVTSEPLKGAEFRIYLPECPRGKIDAHASSGNGKEALPGGKETILFADDEESLRTMGKVFLERLGYKVILARDAEEAVRTFAEHPEISAAVLDVTMPKLTGRDMVHHIFKANPAARILLASGFSAETSPEEFLAFGAGGFIQKPYTIYPLAHALRRVLDR